VPAELPLVSLRGQTASALVPSKPIFKPKNDMAYKLKLCAHMLARLQPKADSSSGLLAGFPAFRSFHRGGLKFCFARPTGVLKNKIFKNSFVFPGG